MSKEFTKIEGADWQTGFFGFDVRYFHERRELSLEPEFRDDWRIPLGEFLRGLGITLEDCRKALEES